MKSELTFSSHNIFPIGLMINYTNFTIHMLEGTEGIISTFLQRIVERLLPIFIKSRVVLIYNNANQKFFRRMMIKFAEPPVLIEKIMGSTTDIIQHHIKTLVTRLYALSARLQDEELDESMSDGRNVVVVKLDESFIFVFFSLILENKSRTSLLTNAYNKILPEVLLLDYILDVNALPSIDEYSRIYCHIPDVNDYDSRTWPIAFDFTPDNVFDWNKYDINLTFGGTNKKR